ncbi:hypothetical protein [Pseudomonas oryzihabitans]|uniref:hypothetical protein n=1 Tax=Pseudomonas oryzihabitans TaxID=47885 RepID=UPI0016426029|nr:hypothetical protein [Pseudomonas psychrotolerans]
MYNLLVSSAPWGTRRGTFPSGRVLTSYASDAVNARFLVDEEPDLDALMLLPALFAQEVYPRENRFARVGRITKAQIRGREVQLDYYFDQDVPPIPMEDIERLAGELGIDMSGGITELEHTHWVVKDIDLFEILFLHLRQSSRVPALFDLPSSPNIDQLQLSAMMPFGGGFHGTYQAIRAAAARNGMQCDRADTIWQNEAIIDDVAHLIDRSRIVVVDCTGRNANVYYELGLAHAWGKEVILITQSAADIPFDIQHIRYLQYYPNDQGIQGLEDRLSERIAAILNR